MKNSKITADELRSYQKRSLWQEIWRNYRKSPRPQHIGWEPTSMAAMC